ncbi:MAG: V-type ATP synthase subunit D [Spirochaetaceae bacterium]|jgi:V/A-type H+-transporting ATPase subunit D|nr:V-type ATP synthase subunit D [Spirochaetaceae bacterium]
MAIERIAPTKSNLMRVKERLAIAREGYELLEQKREILVMELMRRLEKVRILERELTEKTSAAYPTLKRLLVSHGRDNVERVSRDIRYNFDIMPVQTKVAGITMSALKAALPKPELKYSPALSGAEYDETALSFFSVLNSLTNLAAERTVVWRLAREVRRTQRRVNALEKMVIPTAEDTKVYIESALEEKDRDSFFSAKLLKRKKNAEAQGKMHG